jgi:2-C-methyl-D-erythritol 4-phosphate cytidylyltransferase
MNSMGSAMASDENENFSNVQMQPTFDPRSDEKVLVSDAARPNTSQGYTRPRLGGAARQKLAIN